MKTTGVFDGVPTLDPQVMSQVRPITDPWSQNWLNHLFCHFLTVTTRPELLLDIQRAKEGHPHPGLCQSQTAPVTSPPKQIIVRNMSYIETVRGEGQSSGVRPSISTSSRSGSRSGIEQEQHELLSKTSYITGITYICISFFQNI